MNKPHHPGRPAAPRTPRAPAPPRPRFGTAASELPTVGEALARRGGRPVPDVRSPEFRREHRAPGRVHVAVHIDGEPFVLRPLRDPALLPSNARHAVGLHPPAPAGPLYLFELADPEEGATEPGYLGLACSCGHFTREAVCRHVLALVAVGLLRPAPDWGDDRDDGADIIIGNAVAGDDRAADGGAGTW